MEIFGNILGKPKCFTLSAQGCVLYTMDPTTLLGPVEMLALRLNNNRTLGSQSNAQTTALPRPARFQDKAKV